MYIEQSVLVEAMCMLGEHYDALLEAYAGKPKEFIKCEEYLRHIIDELHLEQKAKDASISSNITYAKKVTKDYIWNKKLEDELTKFFKVGKINIYWQAGQPNGYTLPPVSFMILDQKSKYLSNSPSNAKMDIVIMEENVTMANLNEKELLAMILHEIGHNFYFCPVICAFQIFYMVVTLPMGVISLLIQRFIYKLSWNLDDFCKKQFPIVYNMMQWFSNLNYQISQFFMPLSIFNYAISSASKIAQDPVGYIINAITGYGNETAADSMAAKYGYGPELSSGLRKMGLSENTVYGKMLSQDSSGLMSISHDLTQLSLDLIASVCGDPHPNNSQRANNMIKKLKKDLATGDYPEGMKKDLENEIARMEEINNICVSNSSPSKLQVRQAWYNLLNTITDGNNDIRQIFSFYFDSFSF